MRCLDLFAGGCNGFGLAAQWMGWKTVACVEIDIFNQKLLRKNFPEAEIYGDIREFNEREAAKYRGRIDLITGGFPCQPFSTAGKREGTNDDRYLWPQMLETIRIIQPSFVIGENVAGLTSMEDGRTFDNILASLEDEGYTVESFILPACSVAAWHRRDRLWIIGYSKCVTGRQDSKRRVDMEQDSLDRSEWKKDTNRSESSDQDDADTNRPRFQKERSKQQAARDKQHGELVDADTTSSRSQRQQQRERMDKKESMFVSNWQAEPGVGRMVHGLPNRTHRIKALGNAVVPQIPYEIYKAIESTFL